MQLWKRHLMMSATTLMGLFDWKRIKTTLPFLSLCLLQYSFICWFISTLTRWTRNLLLWVYPLHMNPFMQWCFVDHQCSFISIKDKIRKRSTSSLAHLCFSLSAKSQHKTDLFVFLNQFPAAQKSQIYLQNFPGLPYTLILSSDMFEKGYFCPHAPPERLQLLSESRPSVSHMVPRPKLPSVTSREPLKLGLWNKRLLGSVLIWSKAPPFSQLGWLVN